MKLKKLAAGILAAVMAVTSAISAPVTASAAADDVQVTLNLDTDWLSAAIFSNAATDVTVAGENLTDTSWWLQVNRQNEGVDTVYAPAFGTSNEDGYSQALTFTTAMDSVKVILVSYSNTLSKNIGYTVTVDTTDAVDGVLNVGIANNGDPAAELTNSWWYETPFTYSVLTKAEGIPDGTKVAINDNPPYNYQGMFSVNIDGLTGTSTGADIVAKASQIEISFPINGALCDGEEFDASKISYQVQPKIYKQIDEENSDWPWLTVGSGTYADGVATITADLASVITAEYADYLLNSINVVAMVSYDDADAKVDMYIGDVTVTATPAAVEPDPVYVTSISISETLALETGASETLKATLTPADADDVTVSWKSSKESVATVDANGKVTAVAAGEAVITATANGSDPEGDAVTDTCTVTVTDPAVYVTAISIPETLALETGASETLKATLTPADADDVTVSWKSSDEDVATVDANGKVTAVAAGTAVITATANGSDPEGNAVTDTCTVTVTDPIDPADIVPQNVAAKYAKNAITVSWDAVKGADSYRVRRNDGTGWKTLADVKTNSYADEAVEVGTKYSYAVYAIAGNVISNVSNIVNVTVPDPASIIPQNVVADTNDGQITISWDKVTAATKYRVRRNDGTGWVNYEDTSACNISDAKVEQGATYRYVVYAFVDGAWSGASATVRATVAVEAVEGVTATAGDDSITIKWTAVAGADGYRIRRNDGTGWKNYADVTENSYEDTNVEAGKKYRYAVYAKINNVWGAASDIVAATVTPAAAENLEAVASISSVALTWDEVEGATKYRIRRNDGTGWVNCNDVAEASYEDTAVEAGKKYRYTVYAQVNGAWSAASNIVKVTVPVPAVNDLSVMDSGDGICLEWTAVEGADGYRIRRNAGSGWTNYADVTDAEYLDTEVEDAVTCYYAVYVQMNGTWSAASNIAKITVG